MARRQRQMCIRDRNGTTDHSATIHSTFVKLRNGGTNSTTGEDQDATYNSVIVFANPSQGVIFPQRTD